MVTLLDRQTSPFQKKHLGSILLERGVITQNQLEHVLQTQKQQGGFLGKIMVDLGYVEEQDIVVALVVQCHIPYIAIDQYEIDRSILKLIPEDLVHKYHVIPLDRINKILSVVMADPLDLEAKSDLQNVTNCRLMPFIATEKEIEKAIHRCYGN